MSEQENKTDELLEKVKEYQNAIVIAYDEEKGSNVESLVKGNPITSANLIVNFIASMANSEKFEEEMIGMMILSGIENFLDSEVKKKEEENS